ncbi:glycosyltransferase family 4 protein [Cellulomonas dongxiuzhuiae]|uniref:Glycosyltransferase family 4 protein n=1 Tax=Cellulomonas dongxiuzhuiae TaxID=2819979 RepID=A0ABX8GID8_9CELL|nr:glycosyltransferase family 1 protein [Cellulomonas dongxiuzhuiae]MBO3093954.1 glycosyltransferase family 4 protein [Cellulomonas dongxiuzhuiae]QWC15034.1 glycosyltransferase family 4 protein [Cellulomonas dongxiuzhuiae]
MTTSKRPHVLVDMLFWTGTKGGIETYARELYSALRGTDRFTFTALASTEFAASSPDWFPGPVVDSGVSGNIAGLNRFRWSWAELQGVSRWADRLRADLIHCPSLLGPRSSRVPTVVSMHDLLYWTNPEHMPSQLFVKPAQWMESMVAKNATRMITISQSSARDIDTYLRFPRERLDVIPLAGSVRESAGRLRTGTPENMILATGNRLGHKNWASLIRALPLVPEDVRPRLVVTGSKGDDPLIPVVEEVEMQDWVDLRGWVTTEEMDRLLASAAALAIPSFHDGFCLPALDAMLIGLPVLLSDIPVYREVGGDAALYVDPHSLESIAAGMTVVATDPGRMRRAAELGREQAARFSWATTADRTLDVFDKALARAA